MRNLLSVIGLCFYSLNFDADLVQKHTRTAKALSTNPGE